MTDIDTGPRELAPGIFWLGDCVKVEYRGRIVHSYNSLFYVVGEERAAVIESGVTSQTQSNLKQLEALADRGFLAPTHLFVTHSEMAHAGGVGEILARYTDASVYGDVTDLHLVFPDCASRMLFANPGDRFDLGGTSIVVIESVFRDLVHSRWYFDTERRVLFPGDGFAYSHYHEDGACGHFAEEVPGLDIPEGVRRFTQSAFHWTQFVDMQPYLDRLEELVVTELGATIIAPTHGLPIGNPHATMVQIREGFSIESIRSA
jgi:flavorubredoxin